MTVAMNPTTSIDPPTTQTSHTIPTEEELSNLLSSPDFSIGPFLNQTLSSSSSSSSTAPPSSDDDFLATQLAELALQLQLQTQSCHDAISKMGAELRAVLPRCAADVGRLSVGLEGMTQDAQMLLTSHLSTSLAHRSGEILENNVKENGVPNDNPPEKKDKEEDEEKTNKDKENQEPEQEGLTMTPLETLETLSTLHALQTNLTHTQQILLAASQWETTMSTLPTYLQSTSTLPQAVQSLTNLHQGARALVGMPGMEARQEAMEEVRDKIQRLLKPQLSHALQRMDTRLGPLQSVVELYASLGTLEVVMEEYVKSRPRKVHALWFEFGKTVKSEVASADGSRRRGVRPDELEFYSGDDSDQDEGEEEENGSRDPSSSSKLETAVEPTANPLSGEAFGAWLSTWYEAVLSLLTEERRRAVTVFGPTLAPQLLVQILQECVRPILASFGTRLTAIYPPEVEGGVSAPSNGSLESICNAYHSTVQFLSVAYEQMVELDSSLSSNSTVMSSTAPIESLYGFVRSVFISIASPFAPYQLNYGSLEEYHSKQTSQIVSKDVHAAVSGTGSASQSMLVALQDAVERLNGLAPYIFPLAQSAVERFELLNGGYWASNAISTIDNLVSNHLSEVTIAMDTLSTNVQFTKDTYDESQIQCALEVLKIAGGVRRDLEGFDQKTKDRLRVLSGRIEADAELDSSLAAMSLPDSLSAVEIETFISKAVCGTEKNNEISPSVLSPKEELLLLSKSSTKTVGGSNVLFPKSMDSMDRLIKSCQSFVFDICSAIPMKSLNDMPSLSIWNQGTGIWSSNTDSYGMIPQSYITHVGEHMLDLVQAFEPFASSNEALQLANLAMDGVENLALSSWKEFASAINYIDATDKNFLKTLSNGQALKDHVLGQINQIYEDEDSVEEELDVADTSSAIFCNQWLGVICSAVTGRLLERTMRITCLNQKGCEHLSVDFNYLVNVLSALGVKDHPHPLLSHIVGVTKMEPRDVQSRLTTQAEENNPVPKSLQTVDKRLALMRDIDV